MPRRRQQSSFDDAIDALKVTPVWVGRVLAVRSFVLLRFLLPLFLPGKQSGLEMRAPGVQ